MKTPRIEEMATKLVTDMFGVELGGSEFDVALKALSEAHQAGYADGYKQGKFDAEVTAEYGEPETLQDNKDV